MIKNRILMINCFLMSILSIAQVAIGKSNLSSPSVSLEFGTGNKGLILPWVTGEASVGFSQDSTLKKGGVLILDTTDRKVKVSRDDGSWRDLTVHTTELISTGNETIDTSLQDDPKYAEKAEAKTMIGGNPATDTTPGILVLADNNKAMVLPKVSSPHLNIKNPAAGMIAYDTDAKMLAVFNGTVWSFWKP